MGAVWGVGEGGGRDALGGRYGAFHLDRGASACLCCMTRRSLHNTNRLHWALGPLGFEHANHQEGGGGGNEDEMGGMMARGLDSSVSLLRRLVNLVSGKRRARTCRGSR